MSIVSTVCLLLNIFGYFYTPSDWLYFPPMSEIRSISAGPSVVYITVSDGIFVMDKFYGDITRTISKPDNISLPIKLAGYDPELGMLWILSEDGNRLTGYYPRTQINYSVSVPFQPKSMGIADRYIYFESANSEIVQMDKRFLNFTQAESFPSTITWYGERNLPKTRKYTFLSPYQYYDYEFNRYGITCIFEDFNRLWVGTRGNGIYVYNIASRRVINYYQFGPRTISKSIWATSEGMWFFNSDFPRSFVRYNPITSEWAYFNTKPGILPPFKSGFYSFKIFDLIRNEEITDLVQDGNTYWISTNQSLYYYNPEPLNLERVLLPGGYRLNNIQVLFSNGGELLIGTDNRLLALDKKTRKFSQDKDPEGVLDWGVTDIAQGKDRLYFAGYGNVISFPIGVQHDSLNQTAWQKIIIPGFSQAMRINALAYTPGFLFIGYAQGIIVYNEQYGNFEFLTAQNGLLDNYIYDLYIDDSSVGGQNQYLWISGPYGLSRLHYTNVYKNVD